MTTRRQRFIVVPNDLVDWQPRSFRVTYIHQHFRTPNMVGGSRSYEIARRLAESGIAVEMLAGGAPVGHASGHMTQDVGGIRVRWLGGAYSNKMGFLARVVSFLRFAVVATIEVVRRPGDVIFATSTPLSVAIPALAAKYVRRRPFVFEVRDLWPAVPIELGEISNPLVVGLAKALEGAAYRSACAVVALSPGMAAGVLQRGVDPRKIHVIPNLAISPGKDQAKDLWLRGIKELQGKRIALYLGTVGKIHGVDYLVRVATQIRHSDCAIVVVGDGKCLEDVLTAARLSGALGRTFFHYPAVSKSKALAALSEADVSLSIVLGIPILEDNSANKFFEALGFGKPQAINYGGWHEQLLEEWGAGIQMPMDPFAAAERLTELLHDQGTRQHMGLSAQALGKAISNPDLAAKRIEGLLTSAFLRNPLDLESEPPE